MSETLSAIVSTGRTGRREAALYVGLAGDAPRTTPARLGLAGIDRVELGRGDARKVTRARRDGANAMVVALVDARVSTQHARLSRVGGAWIVENLASKNGTWLGRRTITRETLTDGDVLVIGHTALVFRDHGGEALDLDGAPGTTTLSPVLAARFDELARAARTDVPVEVRGDTGTGKELAARAVHDASGRPGKFVAVNCGALAPSLLEGELFGHRRGAYTGADDERVGLIRSADRGTLFLDEIAELPMPAQAALLRVLEEREVRPVGGDQVVRVDLRIVCATHRDLDAAVAADRFRADLRARLLGASITLPPLRERREDLGLMIPALLDRHRAPAALAFSADAVIALYAHAWPLNVRELDRALAGAIAVAGERVELHHLPEAARAQAPAAPAQPIGELSDEDRALRETLVTSLARHGGNLAAVARELGKDRTQIRRWLKRLGVRHGE